MKIFYVGVIIFLLCCTVNLIHYLAVGTAVYGDGRYYYITTRSLALDGDLKFANEYREYDINERTLDTGNQANKYSPGASLVWLIPFALVHGVVKVVGANASGYTWPYQFVVSLTSIVLGTVGILLVYRSLVKFYSQRVSALSSLALLFATNVFFYVAVDVVNSHAISFFFASLLLYLLCYNRRTVLIGLVAGLLALTRTQDVLWLGFVLAYFCMKEKDSPSSLIKSLAEIIGTFLLVFAVQLIFWQIIYGSYLSPYLGGREGFYFSRPQFLGVLVNPDSGLILWTPLVFIALIIFLVTASPKKTIFFTLSKFFIIGQLYLVSSWSSWDQGASFGNRMMISAMPYIAFGFGQILSKLEGQNKLLTYGTLAVTIGINAVLITVYLSTH